VFNRRLMKHEEGNLWVGFEKVALKQKDEHLWEIRFSSYHLGVLNELTMKITPLLS